MTLDMTELKILRYCSKDWVPIKPLFEVEPRSNLYRRMKGLIDEGYLEKKSDQYRTTLKGLSALSDENIEFDWNMLENKIPHLKLINNDLQRSQIELLITAIIARRDGILECHHPTFVMFGPTFRGKTWTVEILCHILGLDPITVIHKTQAEAGNSTLFRRGPKGQFIWKSEILTLPIACFDEFHLASDKTRQNILVYAQGELNISVESEKMRINPVPVLVYNPREGEEVGERIRFEPQNLRRSIVCDFTHVIIAEKDRKDGEKIKEKIMDLPPAKLPPHKSTCEKYRTVVFDFLAQCRKDECDFIIDGDMVLMLCASMTAFLPDELAILLTLKRYLTVIETLGYIKPDWRQMLDDMRKEIWESPKGVRDNANEGCPKKNLSNLPIDFDYEYKLELLKKIIDNNEISIEHMGQIVKDHLAMEREGYDIGKLIEIKGAIRGSELDTAIISIKKAGGLARLLEERNAILIDLDSKVRSRESKIKDLSSMVHDLGSSPDRVKDLVRIQEELDRQDLTVNELELFLGTFKEITDLGLDPHEAHLLANEINLRGGSISGISEVLAEIDYFQLLGKAIKNYEEKRDEFEKKNIELMNINDKTIEEMEKNEIIVKNLEIKKNQLETEITNNTDKIDGLNKSFDDMTGIKNSFMNIDKIKHDLEKQIIDMNKTKEKLNTEMEILKREYDENKEQIAMGRGFQELLINGIIPTYDKFWSNLNLIASKNKYLDKWKNEYTEYLSDELRKSLINHFIDKYRHDIISKEIYQQDIELKDNEIRRLKEKIQELEKKVKNR